MKRIYLAMAIALLIANISPPLWAQSTDGNILGFVFDGNRGEPVRGAEVSVEGQPGLTAVTDLTAHTISSCRRDDTVSVSASNYLPAKISGVIVASGETADGSLVVVTQNTVTTVEVVETIEASVATAAAVMIERKLAPVVSDSLSTEECPAHRMRQGLWKRSRRLRRRRRLRLRAWLGRALQQHDAEYLMLPTTEPERRVVPLDLFRLLCSATSRS
jgi:hypothetical protein